MKFEKHIQEPLDETIYAKLNTDHFHIVITGDVGKGKSTLLKKMLEKVKPDSGFITERLVNVPHIKNGIYINSAISESRFYTDENRCAVLDDNSEKGNCSIIKRNTEVFDTLGVSFLKKGNLYVMDEIGFLERDAHLFLQCINEIFESSSSVLTVIKNRDINYLNNIRNRKDNFLIIVGDDFTYTCTKQ